MSESKWAYFVMTSLFFINNSINPTVYLFFNTQVSFLSFFSMLNISIIKDELYLKRIIENDNRALLYNFTLTLLYFYEIF